MKINRLCLIYNIVPAVQHPALPAWHPLSFGSLQELKKSHISIKVPQSLKINTLNEFN